MSQFKLHKQWRRTSFSIYIFGFHAWHKLICLPIMYAQFRVGVNVQDYVVGYFISIFQKIF